MALALLTSLISSCASPPRFEISPPVKTATWGSLIVDFDGDLTPYEPLLDELVTLREVLHGKLNLPTADRPILVRLFSDSDQLQQVIHARYPFLPERRAYFVDDEDRLTVFAWAGPHLAEDLRHEVSHGYLHSVLPGIPLWLDEGLAEYFEVGVDQQGWNAPHAEALRHYRAQGQWHADLARLERLTTIEQMTQLDYAESWAWVYFLLHGDTQRAAILTGYLNSLRVGNRPPPLSAQLPREIYRPEQELENSFFRR